MNDLTWKTSGHLASTSLNGWSAVVVDADTHPRRAELGDYPPEQRCGWVVRDTGYSNTIKRQEFAATPEAARAAAAAVLRNLDGRPFNEILADTLAGVPLGSSKEV